MNMYRFMIRCEEDSQIVEREVILKAHNIVDALKKLETRMLEKFPFFSIINPIGGRVFSIKKE